MRQYLVITGKNQAILKLFSGFKSNKRSHSGDNGDEDPPVPIPNTEVKLVYGESSLPSKVREDSKLPDFNQK